MAIKTIDDGIVLIDCGSTQVKNSSPGSELAYAGLQRVIKFVSPPRSFVLSHFHSDHYSGLIFAHSFSDISKSFPVTHLYYPKMPSFPNDRNFFNALWAMNFRLLGDDTGLADYELIKLIKKLNGGTQLNFTPLCQGMDLIVGGSSFSVLWPPPRITAGSRMAQVALRALQIFNEALVQDRVLQQWYRYVQENGFFEQYFSDQLSAVEREITTVRPTDNAGEKPLPEFRTRVLPPIVERANSTLREVANHFSLSFHHDNNFLLFLGDLESTEINAVCKELLNRKVKKFQILTDAHHGTHWNDALFFMRSKYAACSCGPRLYRKVQLGYKIISEAHLSTSLNGDLYFIPTNTEPMTFILNR